MKGLFYIVLVYFIAGSYKLHAKAIDTLLLQKLSLHCTQMLQEGNNNQANKTAKKILDLVNKVLVENNGNSRIQTVALQSRAVAYKNLGRLEEYKGNYYPALQFYFKVLYLEKQIGKSARLAHAYTDVGVMYSYLGNYPVALTNTISALKLSERFHDTIGLIDAYTNLGALYEKQELFDEALKMHFRSIKLSQAIHDTSGMVYSWNNIGNVYGQQNKLDEALTYFEKAIGPCIKQKDTNTLASLYMNTGNVYRLKKQAAKAIEYYTKSYGLLANLNNSQGKANIMINLGLLKIDQKSPNEAIDHFKKALEIANATQGKEVVKNAYGGLVEAYTLLNDSKKTYESYKMFVAYSDSLLNEENSRKSVQLEMEYEFEKKQASDSLQTASELHLKKLHFKQEAKHRNMLIYLGLCGFICMVLVALLIYRANRQKNKANRLIAEQKLMVERKQEEIIASIHYAKRIQQALLANEKYIERTLTKLNK